ncbi:MAG: imidazoleglycerol-phosphate dehydratase HisB [Spirochaetaceae bacterium]|nr:MAG: imidazoleglycerol-phosphate dehydratase HisB [Spirochaetaceae bacterium]
MNPQQAEVIRETKETRITVRVDLSDASTIDVDTGIAFFDHMLTGMAFHGSIGLSVRAEGDLDVEYHHTVEDVGLVFGDALHQVFNQVGSVHRFGHAIIPMDDALGEAVVDVCNRPYLVYNADYPQDYCGRFPVALFREFFWALAVRARINLHLIARYGLNSHHMTEALFKAMGRALSQAYTPKSGGGSTMSTKGTL